MYGERWKRISLKSDPGIALMLSKIIQDIIITLRLIIIRD